MKKTCKMHQKNTKKARKLPGRFSGPPWHPQGPFLGRFRGPDSAPFAVPIVAPSRSGLRSETWSVRGPHQGGSRQETRPDQARPTQADQAETKPTRQGQGDKAKETKPARPNKLVGVIKQKNGKFIQFDKFWPCEIATRSFPDLKNSQEILQKVFVLKPCNFYPIHSK